MTAIPGEDGYKIDDTELTTLKLIGTLVEPQEHSTNLNFKLNDGSGTIECKQWIEKDAGAFGKLRSLRYNNKIALMWMIDYNVILN